MAQFDEQSIRRIVETVLRSERSNRSRQVRGKKSWQQVAGSLGHVRCAARAKGAFTTSTATITVDNVTVEVGSSPLDDPDDLTEELSVKNRFGYEGDDNDDLVIAWRQDTGEWYLLQKGC